MSELILETERLILKPSVLDEFEAWATFYEDADALKYIGGAQVRSVAWRTFTQAAGAWALQGYGMFSVIEKETGRWIGRVGANHPEGWPGTEVGWAIERAAWGKGYAFEAAAASMDYAIGQLGWTEVIHCIAPENLASRRLAERLGSTILRRAVLPPPVTSGEVDIWGQSSAAWRARRRA
jgi:RimJ/RimL family protein N-acetyltransferase